MRRQIWKLYDNELKRVENVDYKNALESEFYDKKAEELTLSRDPKNLYFMPNPETAASCRLLFSLLSDLRGKRVLDCCCGMGSMSLFCAQKGASVIGIDISKKMLEFAEASARIYQLSNRVEFRLLPVEKMDFPDAQFDIVVGVGALHHLQLELASKEICRVLKKGGKAVFLEPFGNSRFIIWLRSLIPVACLESPGGGTLRYREILRLHRYFTRVEIYPFRLFARIVRLSSFARFWNLLEKMDGYILKTFPALHWWAGAAVLQLVK